MQLRQYCPETVIRFLMLYCACLCFFSLFRGILLLTEIGRIDSAVNTADILHAFIIGIRFDVVITGYVLLLPYLIQSVLSFSKRQFSPIRNFSKGYITILVPLAFLVCAIDIPYFNHFFARLSIGVFEWIDSPEFVLKMVLEEPRYWLAIIPLVLIIFAFIKILQRIKPTDALENPGNKALKIIIGILFLGIMLVGIRGRFEEKSPIRVGTAYFSNNAFLNQLGLNPNFTLIRSYLDSKKSESQRVQLMDDQEALANEQLYLNIQAKDGAHPLLRHVVADSSKNSGYNVVLVIMESMSAAKMARHGNSKNLTPFLDSLSYQGYYFDNAYTAGIHTFNGIFSSLFAYPALFRQHPMKAGSSMPYHGIFSTLGAHHYSSIYFTTHDGQFDNVEGFLKSNDCQVVISKSDYPSEAVKTTLGVPDDFMFEFSIPILNKLAQKNKPFCAAFMTASDHGPYYIPEYFKPKNTAVKEQIVEYADYALRKFMDLASKQSWFDNTIFVFVADHGAALDGLYDMSIDYNHSPLLFYAPSLIPEPKTFDAMAGQIDIFPSVMGLLGLEYGNTTLGIDLFKDKRPYIFFNADDKYGVIDHEWYLIVRNDQSKSLYKYRSRDTHNYATEQPEIVKKMDLYAKSNLQTFQYCSKQRR